MRETFYAPSWSRDDSMVATRANGQPAFGLYLPDPHAPILHIFRALNPADMSEAGVEAKKYMATAVISGAVLVEGLNRALAGHSALENDRDHVADIDMTKIWGPDPKTGSGSMSTSWVQLLTSSTRVPAAIQ